MCRHSKTDKIYIMLFETLTKNYVLYENGEELPIIYCKDFKEFKEKIIKFFGSDELCC